MALVLVGTSEVVELVMTWAIVLVLLVDDARIGADAEVVVDGVPVWLVVVVFVVFACVVDAEAVNVRVEVLADKDGVTMVVTTTRFTDVCEL